MAKWEYDGSGSSSNLLKLTHYVNGLEFEYDTASPSSPDSPRTRPGQPSLMKNSQPVGVFHGHAVISA